MVFIFIIFIGIIIVSCVLGAYAKRVVANVSNEAFTSSSQSKDVMQTSWSCEKVSVNGAFHHVISRKNLKGEPECVSFDKSGDIKDPSGKCSSFPDATTCQEELQNAAILKPSTCSREESVRSETTCGALRERLWQCRNVGNDTVYALRKNSNKDIECMGYTYEACTPFKTLMECTKSIGMIDNDKHLACGDMMYHMFGTDGYSKEGHYCKNLKNVII